MKSLFKKKIKTPTDKEILEHIYHRYYDEYNDDKNDRISLPYVPLDLDQIAKDLGISRLMLFGRLFYHLTNKYKTDDKNTLSKFFQTQLKGETKTESNVVHFPLVGAILAEMRTEEKKTRISNVLSIAALVISIIAALKA